MKKSETTLALLGNYIGVKKLRQCQANTSYSLSGKNCLIRQGRFSLRSSPRNVRYMSNIKSLTAFSLSGLAMVMASFVKPAEAAVIISPVSATASSQINPTGNIGNTIDQSGLSIGFTSGVTDFV